MIRSTKELIYDSRGLKNGIIQIEVSNWAFDPNAKRYAVRVDDYLIYNDNVLDNNLLQSEYIAEHKLSINSKLVYFTELDINNLIGLLEVDDQLNYTDRLSALISKALLYITQQEPVYGSTSTDWYEII